MMREQPNRFFPDLSGAGPSVINIMPAIIKKIADETPWPPTPKAGEVVQLKRRVA